MFHLSACRECHYAFPPLDLSRYTFNDMFVKLLYTLYDIHRILCIFYLYVILKVLKILATQTLVLIIRKYNARQLNWLNKMYQY